LTKERLLITYINIHNFSSQIENSGIISQREIFATRQGWLQSYREVLLKFNANLTKHFVYHRFALRDLISKIKELNFERRDE